jgi:hypothetical protein
VERGQPDGAPGRLLGEGLLGSLLYMYFVPREPEPIIIKYHLYFSYSVPQELGYSQ